MHVLVVGSGIAGMCSAWALSRAGVRVTLIEQDAIPGARAASNDAHRLLRHGYEDQDGYSQMTDHALRTWDLLWHDLGESHFVNTGVLTLSSGPGDFADRCIAQYQRLGLTSELMEREALEERYPAIFCGHLARGSLQPDGGVLLASRILRGIGSLLQEADVDLMPGRKVVHVNLNDASAVLEDDTRLQADRIIITTGPWASQLFDDLRDELVAIRQASAYVEVDEPSAQRWSEMPAVLDFGSDEGVYCIGPVAGTRMKFGVEAHGQAGDPDDSRFARAREGLDVMQPVRSLLTDPGHYRVVETRVCFYSRGRDERYVVRRGERGVAVTGCAGHMFKMGAVIGQGLGAWAQGLVAGTDLENWLRGDASLATLPSQFEVVARPK